MAFWERDIPALFNDFAIEINLPSREKFKAIFENNNEFTDRTDFSFESSKPTLTLSNADVDRLSLKKKDLLYVEGVTYSIASVKKGIGVAVIELIEED